MIKVVIPAEGLLGWGGGVDFLKFYLSILSRLEHIKTTVIIPYNQLDQRIIRKVKDCIKRMIGLPVYKSYDYSTFWREYPDIQIKMYRKGSQPDCLKNADLVFLAMQPIQGIERSKVIGYIPDLQHIYFPDFFTERERRSRNELFVKMMENCGTILVNSQHTQNSLKEHYSVSSSKCNFFSMKFLPLANNLDVLKTDIEKYQLPKRYFMFSNQLWVHKDLPTALRAMALLLQDEQCRDVELICSGATYDYRSPDYFGQIEQLIQDLGISENVRFLGFIPKNEQLAILRNSVSLIQTTLFEGGPGGGAAYDAVAYGASAIISDIEINLEIKNDRVSFFKAGNPGDLCLKMIERLKYPLEPLPIVFLEESRESNSQQACFDIDKLITNTVQNRSNHLSV